MTMVPVPVAQRDNDTRDPWTPDVLAAYAASDLPGEGTHGAAALDLIASAHDLPAQTRLELAAHVGELLDWHDRWLYDVVTCMLRRERLATAR